MNKFNIFLAKYGLIIFFISILLFVTFLGEINSKLLLVLFPIYMVGGIIYLGNNNADYIDYISKRRTQKSR